MIVKMLSQLQQFRPSTSVRNVFDTSSLATLATTLSHHKTINIPPNLITTDCTMITPEMLPLIELSQAEIDMVVAQVPGGVSNIQDIYGLAPLQHSILFHNTVVEQVDPYLLITQMKFKDRAALECYATAMQHVIERHDILRTIFIWEGLREPAQVVLRQVPSPLTEVAINYSDDPVKGQLCDRFSPHHHKIDLKQAPLLRLLAAPTPDGSWIGLQFMHRIIGNHIAFGTLHAEVQSIFDGENYHLPMPTPIRQLVAQVRLSVSQADHKKFFTEMLADVDTPTLPFGLNNVHLNDSEISEAHLKLSQDLNNQLRAHACHFHVSLASLCHLAWAQVLARTSGSGKVVFGTVLLGRLQSGEGSESAMGLLNNTLPLRIDIDETTIENAVHKTHARLSALLMHEHATLALAQCSGVLNGVPLFSALLNYRRSLSEEHLNKIPVGYSICSSKEVMNYPLSLTVDDDGNTLSLTAQVVSSISATRICAYMQQALVSLVDALKFTLQQPVRTLTVVPPEEREMFLKHWNNTAVTFPTERCMHELFEAQAKRDGQTIAVECEGQTMTYTEVNCEANRLAHYLITQGVKPDDRVALCVKRSLKMIIAMLGILKSGAAYVPLDPVYSNQRLRTILKDADPLYLLADSTGQTALGDHGMTLVDLDEPLPSNLPIDNTNPIELGLTPAHLAYVIYTSGSTGTPKGVMVEHRQVINYLYAIDHRYKFTAEDIWCLFTTISFDISLVEIGGAWYYGGKLVIVPQEVIHSPSELYRLICEQGVTIIDHTPSALKALQIAESESTQSHSLRSIIFGGEPSEPVSLRRWYKTQYKYNPRLCHMYGPTEATISATTWMYDITIPENAVLPIGRPLANIRTYLLDTFGELVPLGAEGELYIGGAGVARGYLNRPELTVERFLPDPFSEDPTARMYRTGDRARYLPDGNLIFLGRTDQQVKIRGFRIEPGEIESHLIEHPLVHKALVQPWNESPRSDTKLVAYVVTNPVSSLARTLRSYLISRLPDYMVPAAYVCLSSFPLTPNGKIDRRALPAPDDNSFARQSYEAPQDETEEKLAAIWSELLDIERISRHDNFFELGGHSLQIVRMLSQLQQFGLSTSVRNVFDTSSLATLAKTLAHHEAISIPPNLITTDCTMITPELLPLINLTQTEIDVIVAQVPGGISNIQDIYGLASLQHGILFHHMMAEHGDPYLLIDQMEFDNYSALETYANALQKLIERHDILRTIFIWEGLNEPAQVVLRQVPSLLTEFTLNDSDGPVLEQLNNRFNPRHYKLNLKQPPLVRLLVAPKSDGSWIALQLLHHTMGDHVALDRLYAEVQTIIDGHSDQLATPMPFRHIVAQHRLSSSQTDHMEFFTEMLADVDTPTLPFGLHDVHHDGIKFEDAHLKLPQQLDKQLRAHARDLCVSLSSLCHLAWAQVLARISGTEKVVFGTVLLGRLQSGEGSESAMGLLINTLPLRIDIDETSVENAARRTHAHLSALLMHEHATLALAQRCSGVSNGLPLFSALLNFHHSLQNEHVTEPFSGMKILSSEERTNYPFFLSVGDDGNTLNLTAQVVSSIPAVRICAYMQQALVSLVDALKFTPQRSIRTLPIIPLEEREMLLKQWNNTAVTFPPECCLHELFEAQAARNGDAIAVKCEGQTMTYAEINCEANRLAHYLIEQGVKPGDRIVLCVKRNLKMLVAILGILKSGAAYVPLDPVYSSARLQTILRESDPSFLIVDTTGEKAVGDHEFSVLNLDEALPVNLSVDNPDPIKLGLTPAHLVYVIYTSGSTGTPKGVMVEHRQVINFLHAMDQTCDFTERDIWSLFISISFDISVSEMGCAWYYGGRLVIIPQETIRCPSEFYQLICEQGVTVLNITPAAMRTLQLAESKSSQSHNLRWIIFGGEPSEPVGLKRWYNTQDKENLRMCHIYGPTEATVFTTTWMYDDTIPENTALPIGRPLSNIRLYLLDAFGEPVPLGAQGELYIGGAGVARGYFNRPDLTAERFLPDPFSDDPKARMYRTGDRARYIPDGNLIFYGRIDQQVKIRGFRIEPGEIESHLIEHPLVRDALVQPWNEGSNSETRLVAYVVANPDSSLAQTLRTYLVSLLPDYMVPAAYVCLSSLPLTPNGKLDRHALPSPDDDAFARHSYEAPQTETEEKLAEIWGELLGIECISRNDNFFEMGGHSLLVMQFINQAKKLFNMHIDTRSLFVSPILKDFAKRITQCTDRLFYDFAIPIRRCNNQATFFLVPDGFGDISYAFQLTQEIDKHFSVYVLPWSSPELKQPISIEQKAIRMISMMQKVQSSGPYAIAGYSAGGILAHEITYQLIKSGYTVSFLGLIDTYLLLKASELNEVDDFLKSLKRKSSFFKTLNVTGWWANVDKLTLNEVVKEVKEMNTDLTAMDIEREALLTRQRANYIKLCIAHKINYIPIKTNFYKAKENLEFGTSFETPKCDDWEKYNISFDSHDISGNHFTMMSDPNNRTLLGKKLTESLLSNTQNSI